MTNTNFTVQLKSRGTYLALIPSHKSAETHIGLLEGVLVLGFMAAFVGLVLLLAQ